MNHLSRIAGRIFNTPLMIERRKMDAILHVIGPRLGMDELPKIDAALLETERNQRKPYEATADGIAVIDIDGTLVRRASGLDAWSGMTSYEQIESEWTAAMEDGAVRGILCLLDSPGGEVGGLFDLVDKLYSLKGTKPVYAIVSECACSAAYAIASVCDRIFVTQTGAVGSIGVWAMHVDQSEYDKKTGLKVTYIYAGERKIDGNPHQPLSEEAQKEFQDEIDRTYDLFVDSVARNRNISAKRVRGTQAGVFFGPEGVTEGLADQVGTTEDAVSALREKIGAQASGRKGAAAEPVDLNAAAHPAGVAAKLANEQAQATDASAANLNKEADVADNKNNADANAKKNGEGDEYMNKGKGEDGGDDPEDGKKKDDDDPDENAKGAGKEGDKNCMLNQADTQQIIELCEIAGMKDKAVDFIKSNTNVAEVRKALVDERAKQSSAYVITGRQGMRNGSAKLSEVEAQAREFARHGGMSFERSYARMLAGNPKAYEEYRRELMARARAVELGADFQMPGIMGAQPTQYDVHVNQPLGNISVAFIQEESAFVAADVFPNVPVQKQSDLYYSYNRADFNTVKFQQRNEDGSSARSGFRVDANASYVAIVQALGKDIPDTVRANMDSVLSADRDAVIWLTQQFLLKRELDFVQQFMQTGIWTNQLIGQSTADSSHVKFWDIADGSSTPIEDVRNASRQMQISSGGFRPTDLTLGRSVFDRLLDHPDIIDRVKYTGTQGNPARGTKEILAELFEVDRVHVMDAVYNNAQDAQTESNALVGGKNALLTYRPAAPSIMTPSAGYTFSWTGLFGMGPMGTRIKTFREEPKAKDVVEMESAYAMKKVSADLGFFFSNVVQTA